MSLFEEGRTGPSFFRFFRVKGRDQVVFDTLRKQMKWIIIVVCVTFVLTLLYVGGVSLLGGGQPAVQAVARVNGETIDELALQRAFLAQVNMYRQLGQNISRIQEEDLRFNTLRQLIDYQIVLQAARRERVPVDNQEVNARLNQLKELYGDNFRQILRMEGLTERQLREMIRDELRVEGMRELVTAVEVTDEEVQKAYEESLVELRARHILIEPVPGDEGLDWEAARALAEEVRARLLAGEDFAELAAELSDDLGSAPSGGDLGWIDRDAPLVPEFMDALFALEGDEISEPVRSPFGYHLIQVTERRTKESEPFEEVKERLRARLQEERGRAQFEAWLEQQRAAAEVAILDPQMRAHQFLQSDRIDQAIAQYREAIALRPHDPYLHFRLALALERVDADDEALAAYEEAVRLGPGDPQLWFALGQAYQERGEGEKAKEAYVRTSELSPMNVTIHQILQHLFAELGYDDLAAAEAEKIAEIERLWEEQLRAQQEQIRLQQELERQLEEARRSDPETPDAPGADDPAGEAAPSEDAE